MDLADEKRQVDVFKWKKFLEDGKDIHYKKESKETKLAAEEKNSYEKRRNGI
jgi:hypothetical protein